MNEKNKRTNPDGQECFDQQKVMDALLKTSAFINKFGLTKEERRSVVRMLSPLMPL